MKKLLSLGFALLCLTACSSDDDKPSRPDVHPDQITKRWYNVSSVIGGQTIPYDGNLPCGKDYKEFLANSVLKDVDFFDCQEDSAITNGTYTIANETLTTVLDGETIVYTIKKLNTTQLEIETTFNGTKILYIYTSTP